MSQARLLHQHNLALAKGAAMFDPTQRRGHPRNECFCFAHFRQPDGGPERLCVTKDFSHDGLYFLADHDGLRENMQLLLRFPYHVHPSAEDREYLVEVVRINSRLQGRCGVGARLVLRIATRLPVGLFIPETGLLIPAQRQMESPRIDLYA
jgi:hypothetical protein